MKLNLLFNQTTILAGYQNVDPFFGHNTTDRSVDKVHGDIINLDWIAEDGECEEIRAFDVIDFVDMTIKANVLQNWFAKLRKKGKITIGGNDLMVIARCITQQTLDFNAGSFLLYGNPDSIGSLRSGLISLPIMEKLFQENNIRVLSKKYDGQYRYLIQGERNG